MALKATIYKANVQLSDLDRHLYTDLNLTLARHPSETDERLMVRLLAYLLHADERLEFTKGLCVDDEAELWQLGYSGEIELWIEVGQPDANRLRKACSRAKQVVVYAYGGRSIPLWWQRIAEQVQRHSNLQVFSLVEDQCKFLTAMATRNMNLHVSIQDGQIFLGNAEDNLVIVPTSLQP